MAKRLTKLQKEYLMWRFKEGIRSYSDLSLGEIETLEDIGPVDKEAVTSYLESLKGKGY